MTKNKFFENITKLIIKNVIVRHKHGFFKSRYSNTIAWFHKSGMSFIVSHVDGIEIILGTNDSKIAWIQYTPNLDVIYLNTVLFKLYKKIYCKKLDRISEKNFDIIRNTFNKNVNLDNNDGYDYDMDEIGNELYKFIQL